MNQSLESFKNHCIVEDIQNQNDEENVGILYKDLLNKFVELGYYHGNEKMYPKLLMKKGGLFAKILKQKFGYHTHKIGNEHYIPNITWKKEIKKQSDQEKQENDKKYEDNQTFARQLSKHDNNMLFIGKTMEEMYIRFPKYKKDIQNMERWFLEMIRMEEKEQNKIKEEESESANETSYDKSDGEQEASLSYI